MVDSTTFSIQTERYKLLSESILHLSHQDEFWEKRGTPNKRNYFSMKFDQDFELVESECPTSSKSLSELASKKLQISLKTMEAYNLVNDFVRLFCSEEMFLYMSNVTGRLCALSMLCLCTAKRIQVPCRILLRMSCVLGHSCVRGLLPNVSILQSGKRQGR